MNREIKFRAYDKEYNVMIQPDDIAPWNYELITGDGRVMEFRERHSYQGTETSFDDISDKRILMQYTGLKDKNGKEIYEGDIIVGNSYGDYPLIIKWDYEYSGFYCHDPKGDDDDHLNMQEAINGVVIGNIYENPELVQL